MTFERTPLGEALFAKIALVWSDSSVSSRVSLQIKGIIETFATKRAQISFDVTVAFHVSV